jgi:hypothetical protein
MNGGRLFVGRLLSYHRDDVVHLAEVHVPTWRVSIALFTLATPGTDNAPIRSQLTCSVLHLRSKAPRPFAIAHSRLVSRSRLNADSHCTCRGKEEVAIDNAL